MLPNLTGIVKWGAAVSMWDDEWYQDFRNMSVLDICNRKSKKGIFDNFLTDYFVFIFVKTWL